MSEHFWGGDPELRQSAGGAPQPENGTQADVSSAAVVVQPLTRRQLREERERAEVEVAAKATVVVMPTQVAVQAPAQLPVQSPVQMTVPTGTPAQVQVAMPTSAQPLRPRKAKASKRPKSRKPALSHSSAPSVLPSMRGQKVATRPGRASAARRPFSTRALLAKLMSMGAMVGVAAMLVATSVPANAFFGEPVDTLAKVAAPVAEVQSLGVEQEESITAMATARDDYTVVSLSEQLRKRYGNQSFLFTNNPNGTIQWPFPTSVPISSGFGARQVCSFCSTNHKGVDFTPGAGAAIQAIADGTVSDVIVDGGGLGVHIIIDHVINGQHIQSWYGHMKWGSPAVAEGQKVTVGQYLGAVGSTGASTGAHLHLEVHVEGTPVDPFAWLKANAN